MINNLILTTVRNLKKNKFFSLLNIFGLAIGMAVFLLICQYVKFERSFENFVSNRDNAGLSALLIALVTVSFQSIKAAVANPVKSLRTE